MQFKFDDLLRFSRTYEPWLIIQTHHPRGLIDWLIDESRGLRPVGIWGHLQGENIQTEHIQSGDEDYWCMELGGNLPPGHYPLLFSPSGTLYFLCPVT